MWNTMKLRNSQTLTIHNAHPTWKIKLTDRRSLTESNETKLETDSQTADFYAFITNLNT